MKTRFPMLLLPLLLFILIPGIFADTDLQNNNMQAGTSQKIAFVSKRDGNAEIYTMNEDGSNLTRLTKSKNEEMMPNWSPDGGKILYVMVKGRKHEIWVMDNNGGNPTRVSDDCNITFPPTWSPDGSKILFSVFDKSKNALFTVNADGSDRTRLTEKDIDGSYPSWSPDGSKILFLQKYRDEIYIYSTSPDGANKQRLTREKGLYTAPVWSPDGQKIAYMISKQTLIGLENKIFVMNADGSNSLNICDGSKTPERIANEDDLNWSSDSRNIGFTKVANIDTQVHSSGNVDFIYYFGTFIVTADGNGYDERLAVTGLTRGYFRWAPNSPKLAYIQNSTLKVYDAAKRLDTNIPMGVSIPLSPIQWSPDGTKILIAGKNSSFAKAGLYLITINGAKVEKLSEGVDSDPVWAPAPKK